MEKAWQKGAEAARAVFARESGNTDFYTIARNSGLKLIEKDVDYVENNLDNMFRMTPKQIRPLKRYDISGAFSKIKAAKDAGEFVYNKNRDTVL